MLGLKRAIDEDAINREIGVLLRNVPILVGREIGPAEAGMALGVFGYWYLGFRMLSLVEQNSSALYILNDCRWCVYAVYRRGLAGGLPAPVPEPMLDSYIEQEIENVPSFLGCVNQCSHIFAESYLLTTGQWPVQSSWECMPTLAACNPETFCTILRNKLSALCSECMAAAIMPRDLLRSNERINALGAALAKGFLIKRSGASH